MYTQLRDYHLKGLPKKWSKKKDRAERMHARAIQLAASMGGDYIVEHPEEFKERYRSIIGTSLIGWLFTWLLSSLAEWVMMKVLEWIINSYKDAEFNGPTNLNLKQLAEESYES